MYVHISDVQKTHVYESLNTEVSPAFVKQITSIVHCQAPSFHYPGHQSDGSDCGLFAIATAILYLCAIGYYLA